MAELSTLARPYAKAAFNYAHENSVVGEWEDFLFIASNVVSDASFLKMLDNPAVTAQQKADMLISIYDEQVATANETALKTLLLNTQRHKKDGDSNVQFVAVSSHLKNFVQQLADHERLELLPQVYEQYHLQRTKALKQIDAYITSAYPLTEGQRDMIQSQLEQSLNATVMLHEKVDSGLISGATIKIGDKVVDDSVRGKLRQLRTSLTV